MIECGFLKKERVKMKKRVALCFWGIARSLEYTYESIKEKILENEMIEYTIYMHTYEIKSIYTNIRTKEREERVDNNTYKILNPDYIIIEDQDEIKKEINLEKYRTQKDPWNTCYNSVDNFILAMYSKMRVTRLLTEQIKKKDKKYDNIIYLRPDVMYLNKLTIKELEIVDDKTISIPDFHLIKGFNDRFAICTIGTYEKYGDIFDKLLEISKREPLHSETIIKNILKEYGLNIKNIHYRFRRIRMGGVMKDMDIKA